MKRCCSQYPHCEHYYDWYRPALKLDEANAELFHNVMIEVVVPFLKRRINNENYKSTVESLKENLDILPHTLQRLFVEKVIDFLTPYYEHHWMLSKHFIGIKNELNKAIQITKRNSELLHIEVIQSPEIIEPQNESPNPNQFVTDTLKPLSGNWWLNDMPIMTAQQYTRLVNNTIYLIEHKKLPSKVAMIGRTAATTEFIRKTFHRLFQHTRKAVPRNLYCQFLQTKFGQFKDLEFNSVTQNFARFDGGKYDEIVAIINGKIEK